MSTIVLNALNYVGSGIVNGVSSFWERSAGIVNAFALLTARVNYNPTKTVVAWKLTVPAGGEGTPDAADDLEPTIVDIIVRYDRLIPAAGRTNVKEHIDDLVASTQFVSSITNLDLPT